MKKRLYPALSVALVALLSALLTALALWCQPIEWADVMTSFQQKPVLYILNALPVALFLCGLAFLFRNVFFGASAASFVIGALSIANRVKIEVRDEPLFPRDLALWKEATDAAGAYHLNLPVPEIFAVIAATLALLALGVLTAPRRRKRPKWKRVRRELRLRLGGAFACFAVLYALLLTENDQSLPAFRRVQRKRLPVQFLPPVHEIPSGPPRRIRPGASAVMGRGVAP